MALVKHPKFPHVTREVPDADVGAWEAQGWEADKPSRPVKKAAAKKPARKRTKRS